MFKVCAAKDSSVSNVCQNAGCDSHDTFKVSLMRNITSAASVTRGHSSIRTWTVSEAYCFIYMFTYFHVLVFMTCSLCSGQLSPSTALGVGAPVILSTCCLIYQTATIPLPRKDGVHNNATAVRKVQTHWLKTCTHSHFLGLSDKHNVETRRWLYITSRL